MKTQTLKYSNIIESIYSMPLEDKIELKNLIEHNIADARRNEIEINFKESRDEEKSGKFEFSSNLSELKEML